jgi:hypothetical protein
MANYYFSTESSLCININVHGDFINLKISRSSFLHQDIHSDFINLKISRSSFFKTFTLIELVDNST